MYNQDLGICIIDSGINEAALQIDRVSTNMEITKKLQIRRRPRYDSQIISHATVCAAIIRKYAPDAVLHSIKILNSREKSTIEQLKAAMLWCLENNIGIIHMSIGSNIHSDFDEIQRLANMAWKQGTIIVAACSNNGRVTYPAALDSVIGVKCDRDSRLEEGEYTYNGVSFDGVEITACSKHSLTLPSGRNFDTVCTNSYAAPFITALVYNIMRDNPGISLAEIKAALRKGAKEERSNLNNGALSRYIDWVENALIVDFRDNGEILSAISIPFKILRLIRPELSDGRNALKDIRKSSGQADTIIIFPPEYKNNSNEASTASFLEGIGKLNKNLVYLGENDIGIVASSIGENQGIRLWHSSIYHNFNYNNHLKKEIEVPAIMLYASAQHVLIELLQKLIGAFSKDGYHAIGISDSTLGILAGLEYLCPGTAAPMYKDNLQAFYNLHDPDVMVIGFKGRKSFGAAANEIKPEIKLVVLDKTEAADGSVISASVDESSKLIYIVPEELTPVRLYGEDAIVLNYTKGDGIDKIYICILSILGIYSEPTEQLK